MLELNLMLLSSAEGFCNVSFAISCLTGADSPISGGKGCDAVTGD